MGVGIDDKLHTWECLIKASMHFYLCSRTSLQRMANFQKDMLFGW